MKQIPNKFYALVTGAAGLLGANHSQALLDSNYNMILTDLNFKKLKLLQSILLEKFPLKKIYIFKMDVCKELSIRKVKNFIIKKKIILKVLVNNAAIDSKVSKNNKMSNSGKFENINTLDWDKHLNVGLKGAMLCSKVFGELMIKNLDVNGIILNIASDLSVIAPKHDLYEKNIFKPVMYSVIKHGLIGLTKYIATYWHKNNLRCNSLSPGPVFNFQHKKFVRKLCKEIPLGRMASLNEYNEAVKFLCTDASSYMTGQNIVIDGGRSVW